VIDRLQGRPGVDAREIREHREVERGVVVQGPDHVRRVRGTDAQLGLVVTLADRARQVPRETLLEPALEGEVHA